MAEDPSGSRSPPLSHLQLLCGSSSAWRQLSVCCGDCRQFRLQLFSCRLIRSSIKMRGRWRTEVSRLWGPGAHSGVSEEHASRSVASIVWGRHQVGWLRVTLKSAAEWAAIQPHQLRARAPPSPRSRCSTRAVSRGRGLGAEPRCCCSSPAPPPRGARTTRPEGPPPLPLPAQLARLFVSNIRVSPLARLRGHRSGAILDSVQLPSPTPPFMAPPDSAPAPGARAQPRCAMPASGAPWPAPRRRPPAPASPHSPGRTARRPQRP